MADSFTSTKVLDNLIGGTEHLITETSKVLTYDDGATYVRGTVLALDTSSIKLVPFIQGGVTNGNGILYTILSEEIIFPAASSGDAAVTTFKKGQFNELALVFRGAGTPDDIRADGRLKGIFLEEAIYDNNSV